MRIEKFNILTILEIEANTQKMSKKETLHDSKIDVGQFKNDIDYLRKVLSIQSKQIQVFLMSSNRWFESPNWLYIFF